MFSIDDLSIANVYNRLSKKRIVLITIQKRVHAAVDYERFIFPAGAFIS